MAEASAYRGRYPVLDERRGVWREITRHIAEDAPGAQVVAELGAGYCDFINSFQAPTKIAFDLNPDMAQHADPDVEMRIGDAVAMPGVEERSLDLVFASNFLEHLDGEQLDRLLPRIRECLRPGGKLALVQPNFRLCPEHYFDDDTHVTVFSDESLAQLVVDHGFRILKVVPRFLPFSMKSRLPKWPVLVRMYLASPLRPNAGQMYLVAERR